MPKKKRKTPSSDPNIAAKNVLDEIISAGETQPTKNPAAVVLGRMGGLKGGRARAEKLSPEEMSVIARKAAEARWAKAEKKSKK